MKNEKELWIEKMMSQASVADTSFKTKKEVLARILEVVEQPEMKNNIVSFRQFRLAGVAAISILAINIGIIAFSNISNSSKENGSNTFGLNTYNLDLY